MDPRISMQSGHLRIEHFTSPEQFRTIGLLEIEQQIALKHRSYSLTRAITALPGSLLLLERTSARDLNASIDAQGCIIMLPMNTTAEATLNGEKWDGSKIGLLRKRVPFCLREPCENTYVVIRFMSDMQNRGWAETEGRLHLSSVNTEELSKVQNMLTEAFAFLEETKPGRSFASVAGALEESVISALDSVLSVERMPSLRLGTFERYRKLVARLDEMLRTSPVLPLQSEAVASEIGVSVRTLQTAVKAVHGIGLQQYLRTRRLWMLRAQLAMGMATGTVSSAALANGFWHMGELSRLYKTTFGELPSATLQRGMRG